MAAKTGRLFVLDGPAASGKSVIAHHLLEDSGLGLAFCPRVTSRTPRVREESFEYRFISETEFDRMVDDDEFAAYRVFLQGVSYGLPRGDLDQLLTQPRDVLTIVDTGTGEQVKDHYPDSVTFFFISPVEEIESRLKSAGVYDSEQIRERVQNASNALSLAPYCDYVIVNRQGKLQESFEHVRNIIRPLLSATS